MHKRRISTLLCLLALACTISAIDSTCNCPKGGLPSKSCPFIFYHVPKASGSSMRHVLQAAAARHNVSMFVPCYNNIPCEVNEFVIETVLNCFERQSRHRFDSSDAEQCMREVFGDDLLGLAETYMQASKEESPVVFVRTVLKSLSCAAVVAAHITPTLMTRATLLFHYFEGSGTAADLQLCAGVDIGCATCWSSVREPMSRAISHLQHFKRNMLRTPYLLNPENRLSILDEIGGNVQSKYLTPVAQNACSVLVYEKLEDDVKSLLSIEKWIGVDKLPFVNARPLPSRDKSNYIEKMTTLGLKNDLARDLSVYNRMANSRKTGPRRH